MQEGAWCAAVGEGVLEGVEGGPVEEHKEVRRVVVLGRVLPATTSHSLPWSDPAVTACHPLQQQQAPGAAFLRRIRRGHNKRTPKSKE